MELLFLGTGAGIPSKSRNVSSLALKLLQELNQVWLFDCGEATQHQILETSLKPRKIRRIFITHLHGDHIFGLPGLLSSRSFQIGEEEMPLSIYGPPGIREYIQMSLKLSKSNLLYPLEIVELDPQGGKLTFDNNWTVTYLPLKHGVLSFGYRVEEPDSPGELLVEKLQSYNIPNGPIFGRLKRGEEVELEDGTQLKGTDFIGPTKKGRVITILGDTRPNSNIQPLAENADVLVHEGTHSSDEAKMANQYFHSTVAQAAQAAKKADVGQLFVNHISARYLSRDVQMMQKEIRQIFKQSNIVHDLMEIDLN
ncbi:ribonuclease Z [Aerococcaceae bacterium DSM 111176]|nr:ribonuclease Z [Aerococcaceae bacterium DSM 111176]